MCDYSLNAVKTRKAAQNDKLITSGFEGTYSRGFADDGDGETAVCVLPGTEIAFDAPVRALKGFTRYDEFTIEATTARFRQISLSDAYTHHDALEFATGEIVKLNNLLPGQRATVLQLPAAPKTAEEAKEQQRLEVVA